MFIMTGFGIAGAVAFTRCSLTVSFKISLISVKFSQFSRAIAQPINNMSLQLPSTCVTLDVKVFFSHYLDVLLAFLFECGF